MITRRQLLAALAGAGLGAGVVPARAAAEAPPETETLRIGQFGSLCVAPQYVAEDLLRAEGFARVDYTQTKGIDVYKDIVAGRTHLSMGFAGPAIVDIDAGASLVFLAGVHPGCYEVFGTDRIRTMRDFKGKTIVVTSAGGGQKLFLSAMLTYVGLDPRKDVSWEVRSVAEAMDLLAQGKADGYLGFPPDPQELRARKIGHVVVNTAVDRPWSQYFCCLLIGEREWVAKHPVATKRAMRAILKAADLCALEPARAARALVERGHEKRYEYALESVKNLPYGKWRAYDPEDTVRFFALRLHEAGLIKSSPKKIIASATNWRFLHELRKELKT